MLARAAFRFVPALIAIPTLAALAPAQTLVPNVLYDDDDFDPLDGQCDADPLTPGPQCTLRAAFQHAQNAGGAWTILLGAATYPLSRIGTDATSAAGDLDVFNTAGLTLVGAGAATVIDASALAAGGGPDRVLQIVAGLPANVTVELRDLTLRGGRAGGFGGGGILHEGGRLVLANVDIVDCQAASSTGSGGGGIRTDHEIVATGGSFAQCVAGSPLGSGGAILAKSGAQITFTSCAFVGNSAGQKGGNARVEAGSTATFALGSIGNGTAQSGGGVSSAGSTNISAFLLGNVATGAGGGVAVDTGGTVGLDQAVLDNNSAQSGGGVSVGGGGTLVARDTTFRSNRAAFFGGGVSNGGTLDVSRCTFARNEASGAGGGGLYQFASSPLPALLTLCTFSGNRAPAGSGGAIQVAGPGPLEISACTLVQNSCLADGAGLFIDPALGSPPAVKGSLLFDNRLLSGVSRNCGAIFPLPAGPNLDSDGTCFFGNPCLQGTPFLPLDPLVGPLAPNGGPTETHALLGCSPAIDVGDCSTVAGLPLPTDQRAFPRNGNCDLGSFEAQPGTPTSEIANYCFGTPTACPCGTGGAPGHGCPNSLFAGGAILQGVGIARVSCDTVVLTASDVPNSSALLFQGTTQLNGGLGVIFGDGLRCAGGAVIRLGTQLASGNMVQYPAPGGFPLSQSGAVPTTGGDRYYQVWYRNAAPFCTTSTFNLTNGTRIHWCP